MQQMEAELRSDPDIAVVRAQQLAKLEGELALQKNLTEEMKKNQLEVKGDLIGSVSRF